MREKKSVAVWPYVRASLEKLEHAWRAIHYIVFSSLGVGIEVQPKPHPSTLN